MNKLVNKVVLLIVFLAGFMPAGAQSLYQNPVIKRSLPDPTVIRYKDKFYLLATEDTHNVPVMESSDLVNWKFKRTAFIESTRPSFVPNAAIWAPDVNYVCKTGETKGQYVLYYSMSSWGGSWDCGIGVATSSYPYGTYSNAKKLFISKEIGIENCIDPFYFEEEDGSKYLFWGSFHDIYGQQLSDDGLSLQEGTKPQKIAGGIMEATYIIKHDGLYYLIGSAGSCCEGAKSTYRLIMARSRNLFGPYVDKNSKSAIGDNFSELLHKSDEVYGPGHCSEWIQDDNGQYWIMYHGFQADDVDAGRVIYLDKVNWDKSGWPVIKGSRPSTEEEMPYFEDSSSVNGIVSEDRLYDVTYSSELYRIILEGPGNSSFKWQIATVNGAVIEEGAAEGSQSVWTTSMPSGVYVVTITGQYGHLSKKIII